MKTICNMALLLVTFATTAFGAPTQATQDRCTQYAQRAAAQYGAMTSHPACKIGDSPRWQNDVDKHYNACLLLPEFLRKSEEEARDRHLASCGGIEVPSTPKAVQAAPAPDSSSNPPTLQSPVRTEAGNPLPPSSPVPAASNITSPALGLPPRRDPRLTFPHGSTPDFNWTFQSESDFRPLIWLTGHWTPPNTTNQPALYLGYDDQGTWILDPANGRVYVWNGSAGRSGLSRKDVPDAVLINGQNTSRTTQRLARDGRLGMRPAHETPDPGLPPPGRAAVTIEWSYLDDATVPTLMVGGRDEDYLGFNDTGTLYANAIGAIYVIKPNETGAVKLADTLQDLPKEVLASLRNSTVTYPSPSLPTHRKGAPSLTN